MLFVTMRVAVLGGNWSLFGVQPSKQMGYFEMGKKTEYERWVSRLSNKNTSYLWDRRSTSSVFLGQTVEFNTNISVVKKYILENFPIEFETKHAVLGIFGPSVSFHGMRFGVKSQLFDLLFWGSTTNTCRILIFIYVYIYTYIMFLNHNIMYLWDNTKESQKWAFIRPSTFFIRCMFWC